MRPPTQRRRGPRPPEHCGAPDPRLAVLCPECWTAVWELLPLPDGNPLPLRPGALVTALWRLGLPSEDHFALTTDHRRALEEADLRPLGFCHLLLEEAWLSALGWEECTEHLHAAFGPIGGNGACLVGPREAHDLQARFYNFLAMAYRERRQTARARNALALAEVHRARGTGGEEPADQSNRPGTSKTANRPRPSKTAKAKKRRST